MAENNPDPGSPSLGDSTTLARVHAALATLACALAVLLAWASPAAAAPGAPATTLLEATDVEPLELRLLATVEQPIDLATRPGDPRIYVAERTGRVRVITSGGLAPEPLLDLSGRVSLAGELGLLGIAFSPAGDRLYANYTGGGSRSRLASWAFAGDVLDPATEVQHLVLGAPAAIHNGGQIAFGPGGYLYWAFGDGRVASNGQDPATRRGSILRIHPTPGQVAPYAAPPGNQFSPTSAAEVWAYGLRNPWRFSFDRETGGLWIADVGEYQREEINRLAAGAPAGANFGWAALEGTLKRSATVPTLAIPPVFEYTRAVGTSVIGGYVYRGNAIPSLRGRYVFGDYGSGFVAALGFGSKGQARVRKLALDVPALVAFGQDSAGEIYILAYTGEVYRLASQLESATPSGGPGTADAPAGKDASAARAPARLVWIKKARMAGKGPILNVRLTCSKLAVESCSGRVAVSAKSARKPQAARRATMRVASVRFRKLAAGKTRVYKLRLSKSVRRMLATRAAPRRLNLQITVKARDQAGLKRTTVAQRRVLVSRR